MALLHLLPITAILKGGIHKCVMVFRGFSLFADNNINNFFPLTLPTESNQEPTYRDDSDAATFKQTLPDLTPDEPSESLGFPAVDKPNEGENASAEEDLPKVHTETAPEEHKEPEPQNVDSSPAAAPAAEEAEAAQPEAAQAENAQVDAGSDESPGKSPSKKKKKFRTPSFLKKSKKKSES